MQNQDEDDRELSLDEKAAMWMPFCICIGVALGSVLNHIAIGITGGFLVGLFVSLSISRSKKG